MIFGLFKKKKRIDDLEKSYLSLRKELEATKKLFEGYLDEIDLTIETHGSQIDHLMLLHISKGKQKKVLPEKKISPATAILNTLKNSKEPLDFNSIKDKIKECNLKSIDVSDKQIRQSIYNLIYAKKVVHGKKRGTYQIGANTTKQ